MINARSLLDLGMSLASDPVRGGMSLFLGGNGVNHREGVRHSAKNQ